MVFGIAALHLFGKFLEIHLWESAFQRSCYLMLATMLKNLICHRCFSRNSPVSRSAVLMNTIGEEKYKHLKTKQNNSKGGDSLCLNYAIVASVSVFCESVKSKSWCPWMITCTHKNILVINTTRLLWCVNIFRYWC